MYIYVDICTHISAVGFGGSLSGREPLWEGASLGGSLSGREPL